MFLKQIKHLWFEEYMLQKNTGIYYQLMLNITKQYINKVILIHYIAHRHTQAKIFQTKSMKLFCQLKQKCCPRTYYS